MTRDRLMYEYDKIMPEYGFASHKGYGSKVHIEALQKYGSFPYPPEDLYHPFLLVCGDWPGEPDGYN